MLYIKKGKEPDWLIDFKRKHPKVTYDDKKFNNSENIKRLRAELVKEQKYLCAYCCRRITIDTSHNEHIEPRHLNGGQSKRTLDYNNIVASCNDKNTCGRKKDRGYDSEQFVSPLDKECEDKFKYYPDGVIEGNQYTIDLLGLNDYGLRKARSAVYKEMMYLNKDDIELIYMTADDELEPYMNVIKWYYKSLE